MRSGPSDSILAAGAAIARPVLPVRLPVALHVLQQLCA